MLLPKIRLPICTAAVQLMFLLPTFAMVHKPDDSRWSFGLGLFTIGGVGANYPANPVNPLLTPPPPVGLGAGPYTTTSST